MHIVHIVSLSDNLISGIKTALTGLIPTQKMLGHIVEVLNINNSKLPIFPSEIQINNIIDFKEVISNKSPDLVIFHGGYVIKYYFFAFYLRRNNVPYLFVPHGGTSIFNLKKKRILKTIINILFTHNFISKSKGVIFLNEKERENSIFRDDIKSFSIIPNGICLPDKEKSLNKSRSIIRFIFLSRIDIKYKGIDILLSAIEKVYEENISMNFEFVFYGGNNDAKIIDVFKKMIKQMKAPVIYKGEVFGEEKNNAFEKANIYILPSLSEGMPISVLEALSYGCPCIVTPQTNMAELIIEGKAGWVVEPNIESLAIIINQAYSDYIDHSDKLVKNAYKVAMSYCWNDIAYKSINEYSRLLQQ